MFQGNCCFNPSSSVYGAYSFCDNSIPISAALTKNYKCFCEIIMDHLEDVKTQIASSVRKLNLERDILATQQHELCERNKSEIQKFIVKLERDLKILTQISNNLQSLINDERLMKKLFKRIHGKS